MAAVDTTLLNTILSTGSLTISTAALWVAHRRPFLDQRLLNARQAVTSMADAVQILRDVMWAAAASAPDEGVVRSATYAARRACLAHRAILPRGLRGLSREVTAAATNYFGGSSVDAIEPCSHTLPLSAHERYWWDVSVTYLDYVVDTLQRWQENPSRRRVEFVRFHEWRRDEDAYYRESKAARAALEAGLYCTCEHSADAVAEPQAGSADLELDTVS
jgi:hypothetical protein